MLNKDMEEEIFELMLVDEEDGVFANSFVHAGAIGRDFVFFAKEEILFKSVNDEKRLVAGPLLIPNRKILRVDGEGKRYFVYFTPETIEKIARKFAKDGNGNEVTLEHGDKKVNDVYLTESWIIEQSARDKSNLYNFTLPVGTWFAIYKVESDEVWDKVKDGTFRGYSIEGLFEHRKSDIKLALEKSIGDLTEEEAKEILKTIHTMLMPKTELDIEPNPCWEGYEPIGLQPDGSPNCVPIKLSEHLAEESYTDYGDGVKGNAKRALEWADKNGWGSCGTPVGKQRANQLAKGEPISLDTIKRMYSFLSRHERDLESSKSYGDGCGKLMYDAWGGKSGLSWSRNKLRELGLVQAEGEPSISSTYPGEIASGSISPAKI